MAKKSPKDIALMILGEPKDKEDKEEESLSKALDGEEALDEGEEELVDEEESGLDALASTVFQAVKDDDEEGFKLALNEYVQSAMKE